jgi:hypothetical protein
MGVSGASGHDWPISRCPAICLFEITPKAYHIVIEGRPATFAHVALTALSSGHPPFVHVALIALS